ncbi:unnamed protein product, partial [Musa hybrid cultivar]
MDSGPRLATQRSCACLPLNVGDWCGSRRRTAGFARMPDGEYDDECAPLARHSARSSATRLRGLWRRIMKEKRRIFNPASPAPMAYDPHTYAQNFDEGSAWEEPEDLSRSFSARFAVPSRVLQRIRLPMTSGRWVNSPLGIVAMTRLANCLNPKVADPM